MKKNMEGLAVIIVILFFILVITLATPVEIFGWKKWKPLH